MINNNYEDILSKCEDLNYLNHFAEYLRETEYAILLLICGHTKYGRVPIHVVPSKLKDYWKSLGRPCHIKNVTFILNVALKKIAYHSLHVMFNQTTLDTNSLPSK